METAKKIHESFQKGEKNYDCGICWVDWVVLWMDDNDMNESIKISFIVTIWSNCSRLKLCLTK